MLIFIFLLYGGESSSVPCLCMKLQDRNLRKFLSSKHENDLSPFFISLFVF